MNESGPTEPELTDDHLHTLCAALAEHDVDYVVIGGMAARLHDTGHTTVDLDVCPSPAPDNLDRLAAALRSLRARLRVEHDPDGIPFDPHPALLTQMSSVTMVTDAGPLDVCFVPAGFPEGFRALAAGSVSIQVGETDVRVAGLADVVRSKRAAGRPKDLVALPALERRLTEM